jgi:uncharacterized OB-fold protein
MSESSVAGRPLSVVPFLKIPDAGEPFLEGCVCTQCQTTFLAPRLACGRCGTRELTTKKLSNEGTLYAYSIVYRSFPGVAVPYVSAIVDLEGGVSVKGNLINVDPDPAKLAFGMQVEVIFKDALGRKDTEGNAYLSYFFQPRGGHAAGQAR